MNTANSFATGKLFPMILKFSIPAAISLLISAIYNIVDRIFVGNFVGTSALAGLSICFPLSYMMMAFGLTCSAGGASLFSLFAGQRDQKRMNASFGNAFWMAALSELALTLFLLAFGATQEMLDLGVTGLRTNFCITPILGFVMLATTFFQSIAKPIPSIVITFLRQILFLIPFICLFPLGINGIFMAQPVSDALALVLSAFLVWREQRLLYRGKQD